MSGLKSKRYSTLFKMEVITEYKLGYLSKKEISNKYGIMGHSTIDKWIDKFDNTLPDVKETKHIKLHHRIKELEMLLEEEKLLRLAAEQTINVAEKELKISIRKKSDSKQSKK